tara:strand:- start:2727 stop:2834 length:108 start_codon:yes stop_codon:yes gene_type:complete
MSSNDLVEAKKSRLIKNKRPLDIRWLEYFAVENIE